MAAGFAAAIVLDCALAEKQDEVPRRDVFFCALFALCGGLLGAKLFSLVQNLHLVVEGKISMQALIRGGFVFYGGLIGGILGAAAYGKIYGLSLLKLFDKLCPGVPLGHAFGRLGRFCAGCCYGVECDFGLVYTAPADPYTPVGVKLFPVQLIESLALIVLLAAVLIIRKKIKDSSANKNENRGVLTFFYLSAYSAVRFCLEFFRGDAERGFIFGLSTAQFISVLIFSGSVVYLAVSKILKRNND